MSKINDIIFTKTNNITNIKSHFVPQFYLRNFGESLFLFDKKKGKVHSATPRTVAHKSNFYGPIIDGIQPLESAFSQIEGESNIAIRELIEMEDVSKISTSNFLNLCKFVALQYLRTEEKRTQIEESGNFAFRELFAASHPHIDRQLIERLHTTDALNLRVHLNAIKDYTDWAAVISQMKFILLINKTKFPFWTSDNPVTLHNSIDYTPYSGLGIVVEGIEMHIPINPKMGLVICDPQKFKNFPSRLQVNNDIVVLRENWLQVDSSTRFLYSNTDRFYQIKKLLVEHKQVTNPKRIRNTSKIISGKKLNKKQLKFWAEKEILDLLKTDEGDSDRPPYNPPNPNSEYIMTGLKRTKSKFDPKIQELK